MLKFLKRLSKHLFILLFVSLPIIVLGIIVLLVILVKYDIGHLPILFKWFDSADPYLGRDTTVIESINKQGYLAKYCWLAFRNPINYFSYKVLGFTWNSPKIVLLQGSLDVGDSIGDEPGLKIIEVEQEEKTYYEYYYIKKWSDTKCLRFRMGYKIGNPYRNKNGEIQQEVLVLQPVKSYSGV